MLKALVTPLLSGLLGRYFKGAWAAVCCGLRVTALCGDLRDLLVDTTLRFSLRLRGALIGVPLLTGGCVGAGCATDAPLDEARSSLWKVGTTAFCTLCLAQLACRAVVEPYAWMLRAAELCGACLRGQGEVALRDLDLKDDALDFLGLPVRLVRVRVYGRWFCHATNR